MNFLRQLNHSAVSKALAVDSRKRMEASFQEGDLVSQKHLQRTFRGGFANIPSGLKVYADGDPSKILYTTGETGKNSFGQSSSSSASSSGGFKDTNFGNLTGDVKDILYTQFQNDTKAMERAFGFRTREADQAQGHKKGLADQGFGHQTKLNEQNFGHTKDLKNVDFGHNRQLNQDRYGHESKESDKRYGHEDKQLDKRNAHQLSTMKLQNTLEDQDWRRNRAAAHSTFRNAGSAMS